jgi:hypothetical protein
MTRPETSRQPRATQRSQRERSKAAPSEGANDSTAAAAEDFSTSTRGTKRRFAGQSAIGAGGTSLLLVFVDNLFDPSPKWHTFLLYAGPLFSFLSTLIMIESVTFIGDWSYSRKVRKALKNPYILESYRQKIQVQYSQDTAEGLVRYGRRIALTEERAFSFESHDV